MLVIPAVDVKAGTVLGRFRCGADVVADSSAPGPSAPGSSSERGGVDGQLSATVLALQSQGANLIHVVDLDQATRRGSNQDLIAQVVKTAGVHIQWSGGVRDSAAVDRAVAAGATRVVVAADALSQLEWVAATVRNCPIEVGVALDFEGEWVRPRGAVLAGELSLAQACEALRAIQPAFVVATDVTTDGAMSGPNLLGVQRVMRAVGVPVVASGGVRNCADVQALAGLPEAPAGVVVGKALYSGTLTYRQAVLAAAGPGFDEMERSDER